MATPKVILPGHKGVGTGGHGGPGTTIVRIYHRCTLEPQGAFQNLHYKAHPDQQVTVPWSGTQASTFLKFPGHFSLG